jgi:hypothetical protein
MRALVVAMLVVVCAGCPGSLQDPARFTAACPDVPTMILATRCGTGGCHDAASKAASLDLVSPDVGSRLLNRSAVGGPGLLIDAANPDGSVLVRKLTPTPPFLAQQPPGAPLDAATIDCIRRWVRTVIVVDGGTSD